MLGSISNFVVACHTPLAYGRNYFQVGCKCVDRDIETHLVIAFARATMCHGNSALCACDLYQQSSNQWTCQSSCQRILSLVDCTRLQCRPDEVMHKISAAIDNQCFDSTDFLSASCDSWKITCIADIDGHRYHIQVILFFNPTDSH